MKFSLPLLLVLIGLLTACNTTPPPTPTSAVQARLESFTPIPTLELRPTSTSTMTPPPTITVIPSATFTPAPTIPTITPIPTLTYTLTSTIAPTATFTLTPTPTLARTDHYWLRRPIDRNVDNSLVDWVDRTYPYGGTQFGAREEHTGVEFVNPRYTPVIAAGDGVVFYAGDDSQQAFGPQPNYYGNLVILQHDFTSPDGLPVFTLYGHLQDLNVITGQTVEAGQKIATVGATGIAIGAHLHFEVRLGDGAAFNATRNPELWLRPYGGFGTLAGRMVDAQGAFLTGRTILVRQGERVRETYTYAGKRTNSDTVWQENFTLGDLPAGNYDVIISDDGRIVFRQTVTITDGQTTFIEVIVE
jgi:hypothetical protein